MGFNNDYPIVYAAKNKKNEIRSISASGGIFAALSSEILLKGGVVYGALFDEGLNVGHYRITSIEDLPKLYGSKYVQSSMDDIFCMVKADLNEGYRVLFSGTPCQVDAVRSFLQGAYDNILLCDIVCHGTPSPLMFNEYKKYLRLKYGLQIKTICFREKVEGWKEQKWSVTFQNNKKLIETDDVRIYRNIFYGHYAHRNSCHKCPYTTPNRTSDITLGDFWNTPSIDKEFIDNNGISLVMLHTKDGETLFNQVRGKMEYIKSTIECAMQPQLKEPVSQNKRRTEFWKDYASKGFMKIADKYCLPGIRTKLKRKILFKD